MPVSGCLQQLQKVLSDCLPQPRLLPGFPVNYLQMDFRGSRASPPPRPQRKKPALCSGLKGIESDSAKPLSSFLVFKV